MDLNPYSPPDKDAAPIDVEPPAKRPISAWILLVILWATTALCVAGVARVLWFVVLRFAQITQPAQVLLTIGWRVALFAACPAATLGIHRRRPWARWVGMLLIVAFGVLAPSRPDTTFYANEAQRAGGYVGRYGIVPALLLWWIYAYGYSAKARRYFAGRNDTP